MNYAIIISTKDLAGINIKKNILSACKHTTAKPLFGYDSFELEDINATIYTTDDDTIYCENIDTQINADRIIFATRHSSQSGKPCLSFHVPGNWSCAEFGGRDDEVCIAPADDLKRTYLLLREKTKDSQRYDVSIEQTHHGPYIKTPCMFVEIGSSEKEWTDTDAGKIVAETIIDLIKIEKKDYKTAMVLGGGHYNSIANKILQKTDIAIGHITAKFALGELTKEKLTEAIIKHTKKPDYIILDWKGLGSHKEHVKKIIEEAKLEDIEVIRAKTILSDYV